MLALTNVTGLSRSRYTWLMVLEDDVTGSKTDRGSLEAASCWWTDDEPDAVFRVGFITERFDI